MELEKKYACVIKVTGKPENPETKVNIIEVEGMEHLQMFYKEIGCRCIDIVCMPDDLLPAGLPIDAIVDDEGLLVAKPIMNPIATVMIRRNLFGNVILMKYSEEAEDVVGLDKAELTLLWDLLLEIKKMMQANIDVKIEMDNEKFLSICGDIF